MLSLRRAVNSEPTIVFFIINDRMSNMTGKEFNKKYGHLKLYKTLPYQEIIDDYKYKIGYNKVFKNFRFSTDCVTDGMEFTDIGHINEMAEDMYWVRRVTIPNDATVCKEDNIFRTDSLILGERESLELVYHSNPKKKWDRDL